MLHNVITPTIVALDFFVCQGERPQECHWPFKGFQRRQAEKECARMVGVITLCSTRVGSYISTQPQKQQTGPGERKFRLDVLAETVDDEIVMLEVQIDKQRFFNNRSMVYAAILAEYH